MARSSHLTAEQLAANVSGDALGSAESLHLARCARCQRAWSRLEAIQARARGNRAVELLPDMIPARPRPGWIARGVRLAARAMVALAFLACGWWLGGRGADASDPAAGGTGFRTAAPTRGSDTELRWVAGAEVLAVDPQVAEAVEGLEAGLLVLRVAPGYPMNRVGLEPGDLILRAGDAATASAADLRAALSGEESEVELEWRRGPETLTGTVRP